MINLGALNDINAIDVRLTVEYLDDAVGSVNEYNENNEQFRNTMDAFIEYDHMCTIYFLQKNGHISEHMHETIQAMFLNCSNMNKCCSDAREPDRDNDYQ